MKSNECNDRNHEGLHRVISGARLPDETLGQDAAFLALIIGDLEANAEKMKVLISLWEEHREAIREIRLCHSDNCGTTLTEIGMAVDKAICDFDNILRRKEDCSDD